MNLSITYLLCQFIFGFGLAKYKKIIYSSLQLIILTVLSNLFTFVIFYDRYDTSIKCYCPLNLFIFIEQNEKLSLLIPNFILIQSTKR